MNTLRNWALALMGSLAASGALAQEISFGIIATDAAAVQRERWEPFFRDMEKKTGLTVKSFYAPDYTAVIEAMRFNKIFAQNDIDHRTAFKTVRNGNHGANIQAVLAKQLDVATNNTEDMGKLEANKPELFGQLRIIWRSPLIPSSDPFVWRKDLDPAVKTKLNPSC